MQQNEVVDLQKFRDAEVGKSKSGDGELHFLPAGTTLLLGQYTIEDYLNCGGFGITYVARDSLGRKIVIKECFPSEMVYRRGKAMASRNPKNKDELDGIVRHFVIEAHNLANVKHDNIVHVHQIFEENDTAYMAMDFIDGPDLLDLLDSNERLPPKEVRALTRTMLDAIRYVHDMGMLHRDISPDNILIEPGGKPMLIDFGAARQHVQQAQRKLSKMKFVKDGYSPQEFYIAGSPQGTFSDLYSFAASMYHLISGEAPVDGQSRLAALAAKKPDPYKPLAGTVTGYPMRFLKTMDKALSVLPENRIQSAQEWIDRITPPKTRAVSAVAGPASAVLESLSVFDDLTVSDTFARVTGDKRLIAAGAAGLALIAGSAFLAMQFRDDATPPELAASDTSIGPDALVAKPQPEATGSLIADAAAVTVPRVDAPIARPNRAIAALATTPRSGDLPLVPAAPALEAIEEVPPFLASLAQIKATARPAAPASDISATALLDTAPETGIALGTSTAVSPPALPELAFGTPPEIGQRVALATERDFRAPRSNTSGSLPRVAGIVRPDTVAELLVPVTARKLPEMPAAPSPASAPPPELALSAVAPTAFDPLNVALPSLDQAVPSDSLTAIMGVVAETTAPVLKLGDHPLTTRVSYSHWDVEMPFQSTAKKMPSADVFVVTEIAPDADLSVTGSWLAEGVILYAFNGERIQVDASLSEHVLGALTIDPDGYARATVRFNNPATGVLDRDELAIPVVRKTRLADGSLLITARESDGWVTRVKSLGFAKTDLQVGDRIVGNTVAANGLIDPAAVETAFNTLVQSGAEGAEFTVLRDGARVTAAWKLPGG